MDHLIRCTNVREPVNGPVTVTVRESSHGGVIVRLEAGTSGPVLSALLPRRDALVLADAITAEASR